MIDPFCGAGTVLAIANEPEPQPERRAELWFFERAPRYGLDALGVPSGFSDASMDLERVLRIVPEKAPEASTYRRSESSRPPVKPTGCSEQRF